MLPDNLRSVLPPEQRNERQGSIEPAPLYTVMRTAKRCAL
jgi:hypothetical protein